MTKYEAFPTYFIPIDADENDVISLKEKLRSLVT